MMHGQTKIKPISTSLLTHACYMPLPSRPPRFDNPHVVNLLTLQFSPVSWYLLPLRPTYLPLRPTYLPSTLLYSTHTRCSCLDVGDQVRHPHETRDRIGCCDQPLCSSLNVPPVQCTLQQIAITSMPATQNCQAVRIAQEVLQDDVLCLSTLTAALLRPAPIAWHRVTPKGTFHGGFMSLLKV